MDGFQFIYPRISRKGMQELQLIQKTNCYMYHQVMEDKVLVHVKDQVSVKNKNIGAKDFKELINKEK